MSSASQSTGESTSSSTPSILPFLQQLAEFSQGLAQQTYDWASSTFAKNSQLTDQNVQSFLSTSANALAQAQHDTSRYQNIFQPEENQLVSEAGSYASAPRVAANMGAAESSTGQAMDTGRQNAIRDLQAYGIDPSSGRYAELDQAQRAQSAAAQAGAGQQSRLATEATGRALRSEAIQVGERYPGQIVNELNTSMQGVSGAENAALGNANTGAAMFGAAAPFIKFPAPSQTSTGQSQQQSKSASNQSGQGGSGGAKASPPMQMPAGINGSGGGGSAGGAMGNQAGAAPGFIGWQPGQGATDGSGGGDYGWMTQNNTDPFANVDNTGGNQDPNIVNNDNTYNADPYNMGTNTGTYDAGYNDPTGGNQDPNSGSGGGSDASSGGGYYAHGGAIDAKAGGQVPMSASPSGGRQTDDVHAHLNAHEFVIPRDVAQWKGQEFFQKLIMQSRKARTGAPAQPSSSAGDTSAYGGGAI